MCRLTLPMITQKFRQLLLYGGLKREQYKAISSAINESNRKSIVVLSTACALFYALRLCLKYSAVPDTNRIVFLGVIVLFTLLALINAHIKHCPFTVHLSAYLFLAFYLGAGIFSAIGEGSLHERTTLYLVFVVAAPMLFALNALELASIIVPAQALYLFLIHRYQSGFAVYPTNVGNSMFFSASGLLLGIYMANMKISGIYSAYMNARAEEIRQLNADLAASQKQLQAALAEAEHANRAKTAFLNSMSHDIRTPMNAVIGFTALAASHSGNEAQVKDYLAKIDTASHHLLSLINDVLDMSRIESGKIQMAENPLCLSQLAGDACTILQSSAEAKSLQLITELSIADDWVIGDALRLQQVLLNILGNAVKFTPGGGKIFFSIRQSAESVNNRASYTFCIKDTGIGMSPEFQKHIFEAFSREDSAVRGIQGTGLGMAITKNLVEMMGGTLTVQSEQGKGSKFTFGLSFPLAQSAPVPGNPAKSDFTGRHILLAEDNALNEEIARAVLSEAGFVVTSACDGAAAVEALQNAPAGTYDLILMDIQMPRLNGYEAARKIRALPDPARAQIPIIAMTADAFEEDRQNALAAGMNAHITKPIEIPKLLKVLSEFL